MGLLAIASLTACGDKVELTTPVTPAPSAVVHQVTVSPSSVTLNVGDKTTLAASVNADAGVTDRTVTWSSADATIASVDANGVVTAVKAGNTSIIAKAKADATVQAAAAVTVNPGVGAGAPANVTVSTINQTVCVPAGGCSSIPANLGNVTGQLDVTLNVDPGAQRLVGVDLVFNCTGNGNSGADTVVASQTLASANVAVDAAAASAPVTLSFNTATFNSTSGAVAFRNGSCTLKARARTNATAGGPITTVTSTSQNITLNNQDVVTGSITSTKNAVNATTGLLWNGGDVTVTATPVMFSGRVPATTTITFEGKTVTATGAGVATATFVDGNGAGGTTDIDAKTDSSAFATFTLVDAAGQPFTNPVACGSTQLCSAASYLANPLAPGFIPHIRLDTQKPIVGTFSTTANPDQNINGSGYVGGAFRFVADSASGYRGANAVAGTQLANFDCGLGGALACAAVGPISGVDNVTVVFQSAPFNTSKTSSTWANLTTTSALGETVSASSLIYRMLTTDALGNVDTSANGTFGVDKTAPTDTLSGTANQTTAQALGGAGSIITKINDGLSGPAAQQLVAQVILNGSVNAGTLPTNNTQIGTIAVPGTVNSGCIVGRFNRTSGAANADSMALPVFDKTGAQIGTCSPTPVVLAVGGTVPANIAGVAGYTTTRVIAIDQAGNRSVPQTIQAVEDATAPTVGALDLPTSATGGASLSIPAQVFDALDVVGTATQITYNGIANVFQYPLSAGPGVSFDNVLSPGSATTAATGTSVITPFARNIKAGAATVGGITSPTQGANGANTVRVGALDEVNNFGSSSAVTLTTTTAVAQPGSTSPWATDFVNGMTITVNNATVSNCPTAGCAGGPPAPAPTNPTSTSVTVTATGNPGTFANPFTTVQVWYQVNGAGTWFLAGNTGAGSSRDTGVGGNRFWDYTFSFTPPKIAQRDVVSGAAPSLTVGGTTLSLIGIGLNANGDALITPTPVVVTLTNP